MPWKPVSRRSPDLATIETLSRTSGRTSLATKPSARTISITLQLPTSDDADLFDARIARSRGGVDLLAQRDLPGERDRRQRVVGAVHRLVGARRRRGGRALGRIEQAQGRRGAVDRGDAQFIGVGEGGGFAA